MKFLRVFFFLLFATALVQCANDSEQKGANATLKTAQSNKPSKAKNKKPGAAAKPAKTAKKGLANQINLTPVQKKKFTQINQKYFKKSADFRKANKGNLQAIRKNTQTNNAAKDKEMKALLKPAQYTKYKQMTQKKGPVKKPANK